VLDGVPALMTECLAYRCYWRDNYAKTSKVLLDAEDLVIAEAMGEEYAVEHFDFEAINRDRVPWDTDLGVEDERGDAGGYEFSLAD